MINESEIVKKLEKDIHIRYFRMPENNGWNSGRALLVSQVQTEYFVSCDDDFFFHDDFNLEKMFDIRDPRICLYSSNIENLTFKSDWNEQRVQSSSLIPDGQNRKYWF